MTAVGDDDDPLLSDGEAVMYLGFRGKAQLLRRVAEGRLVPADRRKGRHRFRLAELRRYVRDTAEATAAALAADEALAAGLEPEAATRLRAHAAARGLGLRDALAELPPDPSDPEALLVLELVRARALMPDRPREAALACLRAVEAFARDRRPDLAALLRDGARA